MTPASAYIVDAVRTPIGKRNGGLSMIHPADLGAAALAALMTRTGVDPARIDDVIMGCIDQVGPQSGNIARTAWLAAGLPDHVPATTVDRQCGSSQQALHFAAQAVLSGVQDLVVAGGVQHMSAVPIGAGVAAGASLGLADPWFGSRGFVNRYDDTEISQFRSADLMAEKWNLSREEMEEFAITSHERALAAIEAGRFSSQLAAVDGLTVDECPRQPDPVKMRSLRPLRPGGRTTAALSSQIADGAAALLIASEIAVAEHGLTPRARVVAMSVAAGDPILMLAAPLEATRRVLARSGVAIGDVSQFEVNEAFASVVLAWQREFMVDPTRLNANGGAIALGHPTGASGARLMTALLNELERTGGRFGLQTMCEGGGQANATLIEVV